MAAFISLGYLESMHKAPISLPKDLLGDATDLEVLVKGFFTDGLNEELVETFIKAVFTNLFDLAVKEVTSSLVEIALNVIVSHLQQSQDKRHDALLHTLEVHFSVAAEAEQEERPAFDKL